jgi:hypothetical protein
MADPRLSSLGGSPVAGPPALILSPRRTGTDGFFVATLAR